VVTFLLSDVEGSTRLWEREPEAMRSALARHDLILSAGIRRANGVVVKSRGEGDSLFAVFERTRDAVAAALITQRALQNERWVTSVGLRVRMAIHTGKVELRERDYYGPTVNRCARLRALGHGGQVLLTGVSAQLVESQLAPGVRLRDLGTHELKDLTTPEHVWQLEHALLWSSFPPLSSATAQAQMVAPSPSAVGPAEVLPRRPQRYFLLTDRLNRTADGRIWREAVIHTLDSDSSDDEAYHAYGSAKLAALLNVANERMRQPRLWEIEVHDLDVDPDADQPAELTTRSATGIRPVPMPNLVAHDFARFAVLCAREAFSGGLLGLEFASWSKSWLAGGDRSGEEARRLAEGLEAEAYRGGGGYMHPEVLAAAHAARTAVHAARTAYLGGRARDEETERTAEVAAEAVHLASRVARLDLVALAEEAVPDARLTPATTASPNLAWRVA
jgi:class 3 adenylate cyclase